MKSKITEIVKREGIILIKDLLKELNMEDGQAVRQAIAEIPRISSHVVTLNPGREVTTALRLKEVWVTRQLLKSLK